MKLILNDFECRNGHEHEYFLPMGQKEVECRDCGETASLLIPKANFALEGTTGHFPTALQKWEARHKVKQHVT
jgi:hypothetical protein